MEGSYSLESDAPSLILGRNFEKTAGLPGPLAWLKISRSGVRLAFAFTGGVSLSSEPSTAHKSNAGEARSELLRWMWPSCGLNDLLQK